MTVLSFENGVIQSFHFWALTTALWWFLEIFLIRNLKKMKTQLEQDQQEMERLTGMKNNLKSLLIESEKKARVVLEQIDVCQVNLFL